MSAAPPPRAFGPHRRTMLRRQCRPGRARPEKERTRLLRSLGGLERLAHGRQEFLASEWFWKHFSHPEPVRCFGRRCETAPEAPRYDEDGCSIHRPQRLDKRLRTAWTRHVDDHETRRIRPWQRAHRPYADGKHGVSGFAEPTLKQLAHQVVVFDHDDMTLPVHGFLRCNSPLKGASGAPLWRLAPAM